MKLGRDEALTLARAALEKADRLLYQELRAAPLKGRLAEVRAALARAAELVVEAETRG